MYIHVRTKVKLRIAWKIVYLLAIAGGIVFLQINSMSYYRNIPLRIFACLMSVGVYGYIVYKSKLFPLLADKAWVGVVQGRTARKATVVRGAVAHRGNIEDVIICKWHLRREDEGGEVIDEYLEFETGVIGDRYFLPGDRVRHYKGAKILVKANPSEEDDNLMCPLCGKMVRRPRCSFCKVRFDTE